MKEETLFSRALELPAYQRQAFLSRECAADPGLHKRVESLLEAHDNPGDFLQGAAPPLTGPIERPIAERAGTLIGAYKLLEQIGEGGFGIVFMAEQMQPMRRLVALKIIKPGMDTAQVIARFESERQALALMDHPNIARVLDAGATDSGRPYFVMELVKGVPITDFCDKNQLRPEDRLRLFVDVCHAIQHAHHKGILHRDIKPSNVLVTLHDGVAVVKVIDFGVAKATGQKLTEKTLFTAFGQMVGTPAYMSPEQAEMSGLDIDTRSDVYSLGVLLYELLTGTTPVESERMRQAGYAEMQRLIREEEPPRPSTRLSSLGGSATVLAGNRGLEVRRLVQLLAGDLDWTVMKALEKDRNRRYGTPAGFAEDIDRCLRREPVLARPPSALYKLRKFTQRNRAAVVSTVIVAASLLLGAVLAGWQAMRALAAEEHATGAQTQAEADRDRALAAERRASAALLQLLSERKVTETARAETRSERDKAQRQFKGLVAWNLLRQAMQVELRGAPAAAEQSYLGSLDYAQKEIGSEGGETFSIIIALADFYNRRNTPEKAEEPLRKLRELHRPRPYPDLKKPFGPREFPEAYVRMLDALGLNLLQQPKWTEAEAVLREDVAFREKLFIMPNVVAANARSMLGASLVGQKKYAEAEPLLRQGSEGLQELSNLYPRGELRETIMLMARPAVERLVQLYDAWDKPAEAERWRKELQRTQK